MPKLVMPDEINVVKEAIASLPAGVGLEGLLTLIQSKLPNMTRRTLQRRLALLLDERRIVRDGKKRGSRYRIAETSGAANLVMQAPIAYGEGESYVPVSTQGAIVREYVRQPMHQRTPLSYRIEFLESYRPNDTYYLSAALRQQFLTMGQPAIVLSPAGTFARDILNRLLIDLSWASSRLEGNTYSRLDTERLLQLGEIAEGKDATETQMILNHKSAIEYLVNNVDSIGIDRPTILALHALLSDGLLRDPGAGGRVRSIAVEIGGSVYRPLALPQKLDELFGHVLDIGNEIADPFEQAFFLMIHLPYLQPFEDVNKRVSRLAANIPLLKANLCPLSFIDVPEQSYVDAIIGVYELNRVELLSDVFTWAYERSCQQYLAVRQQLVPPDTFRLRYRSALNECVRAIVNGGHDVEPAAIAAVIPARVEPADRDRFVAMVKEEFAHMHANNAVRYGLSALAFDDWQQEHLPSVVDRRQK